MDPKEYERRRAQDEAKQDYRDREKYFLNEYPPIGKRAQREFLGFGPGGGAFGLTFTTSDGKFDIRIIISNLLPNEVEMPDFDIIETAKRISQLYDRKSG